MHAALLRRSAIGCLNCLLCIDMDIPDKLIEWANYRSGWLRVKGRLGFFLSTYLISCFIAMAPRFFIANREYDFDDIHERK
jgi:hypothetical protein